MSKREQFLIYCMQFIGLPYIWGCGDPKIGLDCSGLIQILLSWWHLDPEGDQTAQGLYNALLDKAAQPLAPQSHGELGWIYFYGASTKKITHVALGLGNGLIIEAGGGGSECTTPEIALKKGAKVRVKPNTRTDMVAILNLSNEMMI